MRIQIISHKNELKNKFEDYELVYSTINSPKSFDEFDVNIISLQEKDIWSYNDYQIADKVNCISDFSSLQCIINKAAKSKTIIAFPQNTYYKYDYYLNSNTNSKTFKKSIELKNMLPKVCGIIKHLVPANIKKDWLLIFENTTTIINGKDYDASFYFDTSCKTLTYSKGSQKPTSVKYSDNIYFTAINIKSSTFNLKDFLIEIGIESTGSNLPKWLQDLNFFDDLELNEFIDTTKKEIKELKQKIEHAYLKIQENLKYKSILSTNGNELVNVVFEMLEKMLKCDLSSFVDEKKEDFVIKKETVTFVGEIKGINSNVGYNNVSQAERHKAEYLDILENEKRNENVKALLVINPLRKTPISERETINQAQINYAKNNEVLIITTEIFLHIYEKFILGEISYDNIIKVFSEKIGLLCMEDFDSND